MTKHHIMRIFILSIYLCFSLFLSLFVMFIFLAWLKLDLCTEWYVWKEAIINLLCLSSKLSLMGVPIGFILWFFYYRNN